ncbi:MAG TPA: hypothetical protein PLY16_01815 [Candidatus Saccharibacteria bacterium]|nr:hypothetical protein [Candidatus Saccharibacteria bacterium]
MLGEGIERTGLSTAYPPPNAWKEPEKWLDLKTGLAKPGIELLPVPVDDRGLIDADKLVRLTHSELFVDDYEWPFHPSDVRTRPDDHHLYHAAARYQPDKFDGREEPMLFRELPIHIIRSPRQNHNVWHRFFEEPAMPDFEVMQHRLRSYELAQAAFRNLYISAAITLRMYALTKLRKDNVKNLVALPRSIDDMISEDFIRSNFGAHFDVYSRAIEEFESTENKDIVYRWHENINPRRPRHVVKALGRIVTRQALVFDAKNHRLRAA